MLLALNFKENIVNFDKYFTKIEKISTKIIFFPCKQQVDEMNFLEKDFSFGVQDYSFFQDKIIDKKFEYCLVGHSDRRYKENENNSQVAQKVKKCLVNNITPILCVGEIRKTCDEETLAFLKRQIDECISLVEPCETDKIIVAYEPVFCIGTGQVCDISHINMVVKFIKKHFDFLKVLYGGSVNELNSEEILKNVLVDGVLVGNSALKPEKINKIAKIMENFY